jgi:NAD(P)-dependent dehydrogenase (short-subunit alcohol dehydrogenase family)
MKIDLTGRVAVVTGASRGMGRAIALSLGRAGARLVVNDLTANGLDKVASELRATTEVAIAPGDVTKLGDATAVMDTAVDTFGSLDILVNNAGILYPTAFPAITEAEWDLVIDVNVKGTFLCTQAALPMMRRNRWGRIVNLSSTAGKNVSTMGGAHYTTAKAAILGLTRHVAFEFAGEGITVNAVCPGLIETDMVRQTITPERAKAYADGFPIPRLGQPDEVAGLVTFLVSDHAAYMTGATFDINGGDLMV